MGLKKGEQTAQNGAEQAENAGAVKNTTEAENAVKTAQSGAESKVYDGYTQFVYVGPSLPNGELKENAVLEGSFSEILHFLSAQVEKYPQIKRLIVPVNRLAEYSAKVKSGGNIVNKYYADIVSAMKSSKEG